MTLLDTHAWLWWIASPELLSAKAAEAISQAMAAASLTASSMSAWEAAMLVKKGRLQLRLPVGDLLAQCESLPFFRFLPLGPRVAAASVELEPFHADPADRIITATAIHHGATLITKDERIHAFVPTLAVW